jgi:hypothetical protein
MPGVPWRRLGRSAFLSIGQLLQKKDAGGNDRRRENYHSTRV